MLIRPAGTTFEEELLDLLRNIQYTLSSMVSRMIKYFLLTQFDVVLKLYYIKASYSLVYAVEKNVFGVPYLCALLNVNQNRNSLILTLYY